MSQFDDVKVTTLPERIVREWIDATDQMLKE